MRRSFCVIAWQEDISSEAYAEQLKRIYTLYHMSLKDMIYEAGYNQSTFAIRFCVPLRTVQHWCNGDRECPLYFKMAVAEIMHILER